MGSVLTKICIHDRRSDGFYFHSYVPTVETGIPILATPLLHLPPEATFAELWDKIKWCREEADKLGRVPKAEFEPTREELIKLAKCRSWKAYGSKVRSRVMIFDNNGVSFFTVSAWLGRDFGGIDIIAKPFIPLRPLVYNGIQVTGNNRADYEDALQRLLEIDMDGIIKAEAELKEQKRQQRETRKKLRESGQE